MASASCVSVNRWRAHSEWWMTMISRVPRMPWDTAKAFITSRVALPPALRMTCASPGLRPSNDAASTRASMHVACQDGELHPRLDNASVHPEVMESGVHDHLVDRIHCQKEIAIPLRVTQAGRQARDKGWRGRCPVRHTWHSTLTRGSTQVRSRTFGAPASAAGAWPSEAGAGPASFCSVSTSLV